ncbi:sodium/proton antiporter, NhaA family [Fontimonas thermophila]|uniref:Na(+)/H(+) antiporter NhaA n=1 Tax=Fontimonas thermophila TaxID=1076937 RepID=A0A1I2IEB2_9GAMM|nr:Na+/H+ antiporter NhaA [Fontimonas thermophila]SFF39427.1 sodium/proton antiporter, NhaA family [Fontimonas thermophila]
MNRSTAQPKTVPAGARLLKPFERFIHVEASSGTVLLLAAMIALVWANSPWAGSYHALWEMPLTLGIGALVVTESLHFWINDGLMTIFFLVVGLEIRRELHEGTLSSVRAMALPAAAAFGGIVMPAVIYLLLNHDPELRAGWAVPTATDIAFAVGVLALLGKRVPMALRVLLLALAIIDDIAAILIIALFYSKAIEPLALLVTASGIGLVFLFQRLGLRTAWPYVLPGAVIWVGMFKAGVHPSISGVLCGLLTPVAPAFATENPLGRAALALQKFSDRLRGGRRDPESLLPPFRELRDAQLGMLSPVVRVQAALHPWVAFGIMPLFALANAGVPLTGGAIWGDGAWSLYAGIVGGLVLGKPLGVMCATYLAVRMGWCVLPEGVGWRGIGLVACLAGIGFTMSIFIANLAFAAGDRLTQATFAVLVASTLAGIIGLLLGRFLLPVRGMDSASTHEAGVTS